MSRSEFERYAGPGTALAVGSPAEVVEKILHQHELFKHDRFMMQLDIGGMPFSQVAKTIDLLAWIVAPVVRRELKR
ncbi:hypothetical protein [Cohnella sp. JJ-181]|uniref:hypothetical protein n=1 Tax=Cohnella rhizoplanae TaxID=2974897 RepID=UPI00232BDCC8|nr:hypothetical protein [Cohnella sp. JJ-181]